MKKYRREMTAREHMRIMEDRGEIKINGYIVTVFTDEDGETSKMVRDYSVFWYKNGYTVIYK